MKKIFFYIFILTLVFNLSNASIIEHYEYISEIKIDCENYEGFTKIELPEEFFLYDNVKTYMETEYYIFQRSKNIDFKKQNNWFVNNIPNYEIEDVEKIYDNNLNTQFIGDNELGFLFENINYKKINLIKINLKDSLLNEIKLFDENNNEININYFREGFVYNIELDENLNKIKFSLNSEQIIKINQINFYEKRITPSKNDLYLKINDCNSIYNFYFGNYGKDHTNRRMITQGIEFPYEINTIQNPIYDPYYEPRFFERNKYLIYVFAIIIFLAFVFFSIKLFKNGKTKS
ncbi:MAG: hypothetical protein ACMXX8_01570 [Candidatus Woesearchaeota archaeon]